jgi:hypothetical protein
MALQRLLEQKIKFEYVEEERQELENQDEETEE